MTTPKGNPYRAAFGLLFVLGIMSVLIGYSSGSAGPWIFGIAFIIIGIWGVV